jgi:hypothetical protein
MTGLLEQIERRLRRIEFVLIVAEQLSIESGKPVNYRKAWLMVKRWNTSRVRMGLPEYW